MKLFEIGKEVLLNNNIVFTSNDSVHVKFGSKVIVFKKEDANNIKGIVKATFDNTVHVQIKSKIVTIKNTDLADSY